jgi:heme exporter protein C
MNSRKYLLIVGLVLVLYTILGGLFIPLGPAIDSVKLTSTTDATIEMTLYGSKTHFDASSQYLITQTIDSAFRFIKPSSIEIVNEHEVNVSFHNPALFNEVKEKSYFSFFVENQKDGTMMLEDAVWIEKIDSTYLTLDKAKMPKYKGASYLSFPNRFILNETIRNLLFHVPMWFSMIAILFYGFVLSILFLSTGKMNYDIKAASAANTGIVFGMLGIFTGMLWATYTWGAPWTNDPKLNGAAVGMLVYFAYVILRGSIDDEIKRAKLSAVFNIFAFVVYIVFIFIVPRLTDSLHPGNGGNPGFRAYDLDSTLRYFFYPAVIGWICITFYIRSLWEEWIELKQK